MFFLFVIVGFFAQMIDGSLGMGYGVISSSCLLVLGVPPALASSSVHLSKLFTNGASGLSHWRFGNVDKALVKRLALAGMLGGVVGAVVLTALPHGIAKPFVAVYLFFAGLLILRRALRRQSNFNLKVPIPGLGAIGGFLDAIGGGGWGPVVTSTLLAQGKDVPRRTIGTASFAEFFVAVVISITLSSQLSLAEQGQTVLGLIVGGVLAAPLAAYLAGRLPPRVMMTAVGLLIMALAALLF